MTYQERRAEQPYRLEPIERFVGRVARSPFWMRISLSSYVASGLIVMVSLYSVVLGHEVTVAPLVVEQRQLGNPAAAIEHIRQENFVSLSELEEITSNPDLNPYDRLAHAHSPLILDETGVLQQENYDDVPVGVYYAYSVSTYGDTELVHIEYWMYFSDENIGMGTADRMARWGHPLDRELIYRMDIVNGRIFGAEYQAPIHQLRPFQYPESGRPIFRIASGNHNFQLVHPRELESTPVPVEILAPRPQYEMATRPTTDPDVMALAAQEAYLQHDVDMSQFVYIGIRNPAYVLQEPYPSVVNVGVLTQGRWVFLSTRIGHGLRIWGYRLVAIDLGFTPLPGDIESVSLLVSSPAPDDRPGLEVEQVFIYPPLRLQS